MPGATGPLSYASLAPYEGHGASHYRNEGTFWENGLEVDIQCPAVRWFCFVGFVPMLVLCYFYSAWANEEMTHLQHKYYAPFLISVQIVFWSAYVLFVTKCWKHVSPNMSLAVGCPLYFELLWCTAFVTFVPDYDWMALGQETSDNLSIVFDVVEMASESALHVIILLCLYLYRTRIYRALGLDGSHVVRMSWRDVADPTHRERNFIAVKVAISYITGEMPACDEGSNSNDLFIQLKLGVNEPVSTRVHNRVPARPGKETIVRFDEVLQMNLPKSRSSSDKLYISVRDQDVIENEEIARKILTVEEIYETFFDCPEHDKFNTVSKEMVISAKRGITFLDDHGHVLDALRSPVKEFPLVFIDDGDARLGLTVLPADQRAVEHITKFSPTRMAGNFLETLGIGGPPEQNYYMSP